jgi:hypothetical protein
MTELLWIIVPVSTLLFLYALFSGRRRPPRFYACSSLLTKGEQPFYRTLKAAAGQDFYVCPKVRVADVINCDRLSWKAGGWRVATWHLDFVLIDPQTSAIRLCIELDDKSHEHPKRRERDMFLNAAMDEAGVRLLRLPYRRYSAADLAATIRQT